ncbi:hypothetical protein RB213_010195 [Colletotrichum asianum]
MPVTSETETDAAENDTSHLQRVGVSIVVNHHSLVLLEVSISSKMAPVSPKALCLGLLLAVPIFAIPVQQSDLGVAEAAKTKRLLGYTYQALDGENTQTDEATKEKAKRLLGYTYQALDREESQADAATKENVKRLLGYTYQALDGEDTEKDAATKDKAKRLLGYTYQALDGDANEADSAKKVETD